MGPHPYPWMVREFQRVIGEEARDQCRRSQQRSQLVAQLRGKVVVLIKPLDFVKGEKRRIFRRRGRLGKASRLADQQQQCKIDECECVTFHSR